MTKFEANANTMEVAAYFDRPGPYFLNRPLVVLLEGLGVEYNTLKYYQDIAIQKADEAMISLEVAAEVLEEHGLGASLRLPSALVSLTKLGIYELPHDEFFKRAMVDAKIHILRLLKHHARIPIPGAWTLVGVADVHRYLKPGEIFAFVRPTDGRPSIYLKGRVLISRSPTIHPGDVQIAHAIGPPPPGSCFEQEPLANTVVFSVLGQLAPSLLYAHT